jgi:mono/diheme cytochrome c family protein
MNNWKRHAKWLAIALLAVGSQGCLDWWPEIGIPAGEKPWGELNPIQGMHASPAFKDQEQGAMTYPPAATVPVDFAWDPGVTADGTIQRGMKNPVAINESSLRYGKLMYDTNCIVCHGPEGAGDGYVAPKGPAAIPNLYSDKIRQMEDDQIYGIITHGQGTMWSYKSQLKPLERWAVVNYVRALQRAEYPEPIDIARASE